MGFSDVLLVCFYVLAVWRNNGGVVAVVALVIVIRRVQVVLVMTSTPAVMKSVV